MKEEWAEVKRDRDAKATQLAPFLALATKEYPDAPADKRLELLGHRIEALEKSSATAQPNMLSRKAVKDASNGLVQLGVHCNFWVQCEILDLESARIVPQLVEVLLVVGDAYSSPPGPLALEPIYGIRVECSPHLAPLMPGISNVFAGVCRELDRPLSLAVRNDLNQTPGLVVTIGRR